MDNRTLYDQIIKIIIDKIEGGYYHPNMYKANPKKFTLYKTSGETMYGLDRHAGHDLFYSDKRKSADVFKNLEFIPNYKFKNPSAQSFWNIIDNAEASKNWPHLYTGGEYKEELTKLTAGIMWPYFIQLMNNNLSQQEQNIIFKNPKLLFHFVYASWNGPGFFRYYANQFSKQAKINPNPDKLTEQALTLRQNSKFPQLRTSAKKMSTIFNAKAYQSIFSSNSFSNIFPKASQALKNLTPVFLIAFLIISYKFFR